MDEADRAQDHMEREQRGLLAQRKPSGPVATGRCNYCRAVVAQGLRFCDALCAQDYETEQDKLARQGRRSV